MEIYDYLLKQSIGKKVIRSTSGGGAGSIWLITLVDDSYFFIYCDWRIEQNNRIKATCYDVNTAVSGLLSRSVKELEGKILLAYALSEQYDLKLFFEDNYNVKIFCSVSYSETENGGTYDTNWTFGIPRINQTFHINNYFQVIEKPYNE